MNIVQMKDSNNIYQNVEKTMENLELEIREEEKGYFMIKDNFNVTTESQYDSSVMLFVSSECFCIK